RDDAGGLRHPVAWNDLLAVPAALVEHQQPDARHVARREENRVRRMDRSRGVAFLLLEVAPEVLHADRARELLLERVVDVPLRLLLEDRPQDVEVPVGVELVRAVLPRAAR